MPTSPQNLVLYSGGQNNPSNSAQIKAGITSGPAKQSDGVFDYVTYSVTGLVPFANYDLYINGVQANDGADQILWLGANESDIIPTILFEKSGTVFAPTLNKIINIETIYNQRKNFVQNGQYSPNTTTSTLVNIEGLKAGFIGTAVGDYYSAKPNYVVLKDAANYGFINEDIITSSITRSAPYGGPGPLPNIAALWQILGIGSNLPLPGVGNIADPISVALMPFQASSNGIISLRVSNTKSALNENSNFARASITASSGGARVDVTYPDPEINAPIETIELRSQNSDLSGSGSPSPKKELVWGDWSDYAPYRQPDIQKTTGEEEWNEPTVQDYPNKEIRKYSGKNLLSEVSLYFDYAQTFSIPKTQVDNSPDVILDSIELFFRQKPDQKNNLSGRENPGVSLFICETDAFGGPDLVRAFRTSLVYKQWDNIQSTVACDDSTRFIFTNQVKIDTDKLYAIVINFEDPSYALATAKQGDPLVSITQQFTGIHSAPGYPGGKLFKASNYQEIDKNPATQDQLYQPLDDIDLKFKVNVKEYDTENTYNIELVNDDYEFIKILDLPYTSRNRTFQPGHMLYQEFGNSTTNCEYRLEGTVKFEVNIGLTNPIYGTSTEIYENISVIGTGTKFLSQMQSGRTLYFYNEVTSFIATPVRILSDTFMTIDDFPGSKLMPGASYFVKETCFCFLNSAEINSDKSITLVGIKSNASDESINKTIFTNTGINYIQINNGGSGYSNGDYFAITGTTNVPARAVVYTDSTGKITSTIITQAGYGFDPDTDPTVGSIYTSPGVLSSGSAADLSAIVGGQIASINLQNISEDILEIENKSMDIIVPDISVEVNRGTVSDYQVVFSSLDQNSNYNIDDANYLATTNGIAHNLDKYNAKLMSKSNEILYKSTLGASSSEGKSSIIKFSFKADHAYQAPVIATEMAQIHTFNNEINNDASDEILPDSGNAISRHITNKLRFAENKFAEDIRVFMTVWQPQGTELKVYAKVHNSEDEDKFDDKYWSELEIKQLTNNRQYSNKKDYSDYVEIQYGFKQQPRFTGKAFDIEQIVIDGSYIGTVTTEQEHILAVGHDVTLTGTASVDLDDNTYTVATVIDDVTFTLNSLPTAVAGQTISQGAYERVIHAPSATITGDVITFSGDYSGIANGDILGVYDADFSEEKNTIISLANTINTSTGVGLLAQDLTDSQLENIQLSVDLIHPDDLYQAFNNIDNDNVVRYVNSANSIIDYYDSVAVKIVPLAENNNLVPRVDDLRVIGVSS